MSIVGVEKGFSTWKNDQFWNNWQKCHFVRENVWNWEFDEKFDGGTYRKWRFGTKASVCDIFNKTEFFWF